VNVAEAEVEEKEPTPTTTKWKCPECNQKLTLYISPSVPPTCANPEKHPKKIVQMTTVTGKK
jgi:hypothetical protein